MDFLINNFEILASVVMATGGAFLALQRRNEALQHLHFEEKINKLVLEVDTLKRETVKNDYLKRIDDDIDKLREALQQTRENLITKADLNTLETRILNELRSMNENLNSKVDLKHLEILLGKK